MFSTDGTLISASAAPHCGGIDDDEMMMVPDVHYLNDCGVGLVLVVCQLVSDRCGDI